MTFVFFTSLTPFALLYYVVGFMIIVVTKKQRIFVVMCVLNLLCVMMGLITMFGAMFIIVDGLFCGVLLKLMAIRKLCGRIHNYDEGSVVVYLSDHMVVWDCFSCLVEWGRRWNVNMNNFKFVHINDSDGFVGLMGSLGSFKSIELIVNTWGGNAFDSMIIASMLMELRKRYTLNTYVFRKASSAGAMHVLTGHNIFMGKYAYLTQIDVQFNNVYGPNTEYGCPARDLIKFRDQSGNNMEIGNFLLSCEADRSNRDTYEILMRALSIRNLKTKTLNSLVNLFLDKNMSHSMPIFAEQLRSKLCVKDMDWEMEDICEKIEEILC